MTNRPTALERAFELAKSGEYENLTALRSKLKDEGHTELLQGPSLQKQLREIIARARKATSAI